MSGFSVSEKKSGRRYPRRFDWDEARRLYGGGVSIREIARRMGVVDAAVRRVVVPGERERRAEYQRRLAATGVCRVCGGPKNHVSERTSGSVRCKACQYDAQTVTVREFLLRCVTCKQWKTDEMFSPARGKDYVRRRNRCKECKPCAAAYKRRRRKIKREERASLGFKKKEES